MLIEVGAITIEIGKNVRHSVPNSGDFDTARPQMWPTFARCRPSSTAFGRNSAEFGPGSSDFERSRPGDITSWSRLELLSDNLCGPRLGMPTTQHNAMHRDSSKRWGHNERTGLPLGARLLYGISLTLTPHQAQRLPSITSVKGAIKATKLFQSPASKLLMFVAVAASPATWRSETSNAASPVASSRDHLGGPSWQHCPRPHHALRASMIFCFRAHAPLWSRGLKIHRYN